MGLKAGTDFKWQVITAYDGATDQAPNAAVSATVPQQQVVGCTPGGASYRTNGPRSKKVVALTFDDGPFPLTPKFYDVLEREHVPATFFLIGEQVPGKGALLKRALRDGFALGDHTWTTPTSPAAGRRRRGRSRRPRTRSSARDRLHAVPVPRARRRRERAADLPARGMGMNTIEWDVDPTDWSTPGHRRHLLARGLSQTKPGSIILMHDGGGPRGPDAGGAAAHHRHAARARLQVRHRARPARAQPVFG